MREFKSGATRDTDQDKLDYEGFLSPVVLRRYAEYLHKHREQADGEMRESDNWQKGIPKDVYMKSLIRHIMDLWLVWRTEANSKESMGEILCAIVFNSSGLLFELLREE